MFGPHHHGINLISRHFTSSSLESRHLIDGILRLDPNERLSVDCILNHAWFDLDFEEEEDEFGSVSDRSSVISPQTLCSPSNDSFVRVERDLEAITDSLRIQREDIHKIESERQRIISQISWGHDTSYPDDSHPPTSTPRHSAPVPARNSTSSFSSSYRLSSPSSLGVSPINSPTHWRMEMDDMSMSSRSSYTPMSHTEQRLMNALQTAGFDVDSMYKNVRAGSCDASSAIWYMLLEKLGREEEEVKTQKTGYGSTRNSVNRSSYRLSSPLGSVMSMPKGRDSAAELRRLALTSSAQNGKHPSVHDKEFISHPVETCEMATQTSPSLDLPVRPTPVEMPPMETSRYDKPLPSPRDLNLKRVVHSPSFDKKYTSSISSRTTAASNGGGWLSSVKSLFVRREASEPNLKSFLHERQPWPRDLPELPDGFIAQHHQRSQTQPMVMSDKRIVQSPPIYRSTSFGGRQRSLQLVTPPISEVDQMNYAQVSPAKPSPNRNIRNLSISLGDSSHGGGNFNMPPRPVPTAAVQQLPMPPQTPPRAALSADRADPEFAKRPIPSRLQTNPTAISSSMQLKRPTPPPKPSNPHADKYDSCESNSSQGTTMESPLMEYSSPSSSTMDSDLSESSLSDDEQDLPVARTANKMNASKPIQIVPEPSYSAPLPPKSSFAMRWQSPQASSPYDLGVARSRLSAQNLSDSDVRNRMGRKVIVEEEEEEEE
jgi:hypothetical protein